MRLKDDRNKRYRCETCGEMYSAVDQSDACNETDWRPNPCPAHPDAALIEWDTPMGVAWRYVREARLTPDAWLAAPQLWPGMADKGREQVEEATGTTVPYRLYLAIRLFADWGGMTPEERRLAAVPVSAGRGLFG